MEIQIELIAFTLFVCLSAGIFALQGALAFMGEGKKVQLPALVVSFVALVIGGIGSFLHLQHWERVFNGFGHLTSGITQELIAIVAFGIVVVVYFIMLRRSADGTVPKWCGILALAVSAVLVVVMSHSYNMAARPIWDTPLLWVYYLVNAALFGGFAIMAIAAIRKDRTAVDLAVRVSLVGVIAQAVVVAGYLAFFALSAGSYTDVGYYFDPVHPNKAVQDPAAALGSVATGSEAMLFWGGVVLVGMVIPAVMAIVARKKGSCASLAVYAGLALIAALIGGACFRVILYVLGFSVFVFY